MISNNQLFSVMRSLFECSLTKNEEKVLLMCTAFYSTLWSLDVSHFPNLTHWHCEILSQMKCFKKILLTSSSICKVSVSHLLAKSFEVISQNQTVYEEKISDGDISDLVFLFQNNFLSPDKTLRICSVECLRVMARSKNLVWELKVQKQVWNEFILNQIIFNSQDKHLLLSEVLFVDLVLSFSSWKSFLSQENIRSIILTLSQVEGKSIVCALVALLVKIKAQQQLGSEQAEMVKNLAGRLVTDNLFHMLVEDDYLPSSSRSLSHGLITMEEGVVLDPVLWRFSFQNPAIEEDFKQNLFHLSSPLNESSDSHV
eukprot:TRINITY_DN2069_c0_g1_i2.p2 TRINITY_DN2069_c0_g1~~TRINITY_DN2069_c0_g1_i2.p2  ORF type:complete len:313 (-),score=46.64 TRINITY_DN2069_c0_g1_i2:62-1000(-)